MKQDHSSVFSLWPAKGLWNFIGYLCWLRRKTLEHEKTDKGKDRTDNEPKKK